MDALPHIGAMVTAEVTFTLGDSISQLISDRRIDRRKLLYTMKMAPLYGLGIEACVEAGDFIGEQVSERAFDRSALGPNLVGNVFNAWFYVNNTIGERSNYRWHEPFSDYIKQGKKIVTKEYEGVKEVVRETLANIPRFDYELSVLGTLVAWNGIQTLNYTVIPDELQTPFALAAGMIWNTFLCLWSLKGRRRVTGTEEESRSILNQPISTLLKQWRRRGTAPPE